MASVSTTVSNQWFVKSGSKGRRYRPRRSAEEQARHDAVKTEHVAASHAADQGEWVVKGKRHNKIAAKEQTPDEKAEAARIQTMKDLKEIEKTISGSVSVINRKRAATKKEGNPKRRKIAVEEKKPKSKNKIGAMNSFKLLAVDSTDDEAEPEAELEVNTIEVKPQELSTLSTSSVKLETPSKISYSFALRSKPTKKHIEPEPKRRVCWADNVNDDTSDEEEDDLPIRPGQSWGDFA